MTNKKEWLNQKQFNKLIHGEASDFRRKKIKEIFEKDNPTEMEIELVNRWAEMFGRDI